MNLEEAKEKYYDERSNYFNKYQKLYGKYCEDNEFTNKIQNENVQPMLFKEYLKNFPKCKADKSVLYEPKVKVFDEHPFFKK